MRLVFKAALAAIVVVLTGCASAPSGPIALAPGAAASGRIGVAMSPVPQVDTSFPGAGCLLCLATASAANRTLTVHTQTLPSDEVAKLKKQLAQVLAKKNKTVTVIDAPIDMESLPSSSAQGTNVAKKDFASLKKTHDVDKLLLIQIQSIGIERPYSAYIPTGAPVAVFTGAGYLVNLATNTYEWYQPVRIVRAADGNWDEPPKFPGLTNAYFQTLELGKDEIIKPFAAP
ncbi:hypothetical protein LRS03_01060 [Rhizobacter sp. J219]|uniref:hypothetical protein n=1 Tax=Rhizobacter sp. J219 TaxID=2898430 RepID=UPI002151273F|nr:hypothetical protein [Rhizobacter sp. J219]MCR5881530.1 hypothetical protein [Rhizobacter sp. J219]